LERGEQRKRDQKREFSQGEESKYMRASNVRERERKREKKNESESVENISRRMREVR